MIADSVKHIVHATTSAWLLHRRLHGLGGQRLAVTLGKTALATLLMGAVMGVSLPLLSRWIGTTGLIHEAALVIIAGGFGAGLFFVAALLLGIEEWRWLSALLRSKVSRRIKVD
jgi:peptidoglycan biosynthesis protein MviN/MurJ (putative lipid II flippase)